MVFKTLLSFTKTRSALKVAFGEGKAILLQHTKHTEFPYNDYTYMYLACTF